MVTSGEHDLVVMVELRASHIILDKYSTKIKYRVDMKFNVQSVTFNCDLGLEIGQKNSPV